MSDAQLTAHVGRTVVGGRAGRSLVLNHRWDDPATFATLGVIARGEIEALTGGRFSIDVPVTLNRLILDYDHLMICGPVFPHEVAGFSGGTKYFFPGIAGPDIIDFTHWLGAVITSYRDDRRARHAGTGRHRPSGRVHRSPGRHAWALVVTHDGVAGLYAGTPQRGVAGGRRAVRARAHRVRGRALRAGAVDRAGDVRRSLDRRQGHVQARAGGRRTAGSSSSTRPHITEVSYTHGQVLDEIGYHCRDYFLAQWDRFRRYPGGVLAHSTHLRGLGTYDCAAGVERPRIAVTLATGIPRERCERLNVGYADPATIRVADWAREQPGRALVVQRAGEVLYRLREDECASRFADVTERA